MYYREVNRIESTVSLFEEGFNCAQALLSVYGTGLGLSPDSALKIASAFGGGMGRRGDTCGAVTGGLMLIGLKYGTAEPDPERRTTTYRIVDKFISEFSTRNRFRSTSCSDLLGFRLTPDRELTVEERHVIREKCPRYVRDAAEIIENILGARDGQT